MPTSVKCWFLQPILFQMLVFGAPDVQIQTPNSLKQNALETTMHEDTYFCPRCPKSFQNGSQNRPKIYKHPSLDPKVSFLVLPGVPGSSHGPPGCQSGGTRPAKWHVLGTKSDRIRVQNHSYGLKSDLEINIQEQASQHTFQQRNFKKKGPNTHRPTRQQSRKGPAAWAKP